MGFLNHLCNITQKKLSARAKHRLRRIIPANVCAADKKSSAGRCFFEKLIFDEFVTGKTPITVTSNPVFRRWTRSGSKEQGCFP